MGESFDKKSNKPLIEQLAEHEKPISNLIDKINKTIENVSTQFLRHKERDIKFSLRMALVLTFIVSLIVIVTSILTFYGKLDKSKMSQRYSMSAGRPYGSGVNAR
jgi:hypothetical protein